MVLVFLVLLLSITSPFYSVYMWFINLKSILKSNLDTSKKKQIYNLASRLRPAAATRELGKRNRTGPSRRCSSHHRHGALPTQLPARGRKVFLLVKVSMDIVQQISVRWLEKRSFYKELFKNLSKMPHGPVVTLEPYICSRKWCNFSLHIFFPTCFISLF